MADFFTMIPNTLILTEELSPIEKIVLFNLMCRSGNEDVCYPSIRTIADNCAISESTAVKALKALNKHGLITVRKRFTQYGGCMSNYYTINIKKFEE